MTYKPLSRFSKEGEVLEGGVPGGGTGGREKHNVLGDPQVVLLGQRPGSWGSKSQDREQEGGVKLPGQYLRLAWGDTAGL